MNDFDEYLAEIHSLKAKITRNRKEREALRVEYMLLLIELKSQDFLWRTKYRAFGTLLREQDLCSSSTFSTFERAVRMTSIEEAEEYGFTAMCLLGQTPVSKRSRTVRDLRAWSRKAKPKVPEVSIWMRDYHRKANPQPSRSDLLRYIDTLKRQLKDVGIRPKPLKR